MVDATLTALGKFLATNFELKEEQIIYDDPEHVYQFFDEHGVTDYTFPAVCYYATSFTDPMIFRPFTNRHAKAADAKYNKNFTAKKTTDFVPIDISISLGIFANKLEDYTVMIKQYFRMVLLRKFSVEVRNEHIEGYFDSVLDDITSISTPPAGFSSRDSDSTGRIFSADGDFRINSFMMYHDQHVIIRDVTSSFKFKRIGGKPNG